MGLAMVAGQRFRVRAVSHSVMLDIPMTPMRAMTGIFADMTKAWCRDDRLPGSGEEPQELRQASTMPRSFFKRRTSLVTASTSAGEAPRYSIAGAS